MKVKAFLTNFDSLGLSDFEQNREDLTDGETYKYNARFLNGAEPDVEYQKDINYTDKEGNAKTFNLAVVPMELTDTTSKEVIIGKVNAASSQMRAVLKSNKFNTDYGVTGTGKSTNSGNLREQREIRHTPFGEVEAPPAV